MRIAHRVVVGGAHPTQKAELRCALPDVEVFERHMNSVGSWQAAVGRRQLAGGRRRLAGGSCQGLVRTVVSLSLDPNVRLSIKTRPTQCHCVGAFGMNVFCIAES